MNKITGLQGQNTGQANAPDTFDVTPYRDDIAELGLTPEQETEFLTTLWSILQTFVHLGIDIGFADPCGQLLDQFQKSASGDSAGVESSLVTTETHSAEAEKR